MAAASLPGMGLLLILPLMLYDGFGFSALFSLQKRIGELEFRYGADFKLRCFWAFDFIQTHLEKFRRGDASHGARV